MLSMFSCRRRMRSAIFFFAALRLRHHFKMTLKKTAEGLKSQVFKPWTLFPQGQTFLDTQM